MSPARHHRERHAALAASGRSPTAPIASTAGGGQPAYSGPVTPARAHAMRLAIAATVDQDESAAPIAPGIDPIAAQMQLRLTHDLRRLKEIASIERKIDAKREMIPEYLDWCRAAVEAGAKDEIVATIMVWAIDVADWQLALWLAAFVVTNAVPMPARYQRSAPALIAEEVATAALKAQAAGEAFPLDVLDAVAELTAAADMHDEIRAKLMKAIGTAQAALAEKIEDKTSAEFVTAATIAVTSLKRAQHLNERSGVKTLVTRLEKALAAATPETE